MWPWSHLAVGYVAFSAFVRVALRRRPSHRAAVVLAVATQLPDLIDKPLAWQFGLLSNGIGVAHSLIVGVPVALAVAVALRFKGFPELGAGVAIGYGSHVLGDILFAVLFSRPPVLPSFLWPVYTTPVSDAPGLGAKTVQLLLDSQALLGGEMGRTYFLLQALLLCGTVALWLRDGRPGFTVPRSFRRSK
ncbi:membrane-bound metal-dependent hydrolase [Halorubrum coriense DSM 10284]|uniref:Membrane-bound metal-dependent hydrolase n=1 Tax=Halorubrum coriense DSM 10284 TaxID=1227466 RepID=M0EIS6_9EURY|nr:metal-dependent hydrolase [Halorubrum coriense]ELZ46319.1 membrane-bound metal-dependent hydrolase [Halorubrum coriense DSM 10284]